MAEERLGLTDYAKELAKWNAPYVYREFPKMLYRGHTPPAGRVAVEQRNVRDAVEERLAAGAGWVPDPQTAQEAETARQAAIGTAAAERAASDRRLSDAAQAEAAAADAAAGAKHLGEIPEQPRRRSHQRKPPQETS